MSEFFSDSRRASLILIILLGLPVLIVYGFFRGSSLRMGLCTSTTLTYLQGFQAKIRSSINTMLRETALCLIWAAIIF